jgi:hypothetical protein
LIDIESMRSTKISNTSDVVSTALKLTAYGINIE